MTGYGKAEAQISGGKITVEIRSLNGKNADINIKSALLPKDKDLEVRKLMAEKLVRGTIDLYLSFEPANGSDVSPINTDSLMKHFRQIQEASPILIQEPTAAATIMGSLLRLPDVVETRKADVIGPEDWPQVAAALAEALDGLCAYRRQEGAALERKFTEKIDNIEALLAQIEPFEQARIDKIRARIIDGLNSIPEVQVDRNRLEQEMIYYIEKLDINEEKQRLSNHLRYFRETMASGHGQGKKLGFIAQEMGREINTTGSKSNIAEMQNIVVRMKDELEQIKEQVLNVM